MRPSLSIECTVTEAGKLSGEGSTPPSGSIPRTPSRGHIALLSRSASMSNADSGGGGAVIPKDLAPPKTSFTSRAALCLLAACGLVTLFGRSWFSASPNAQNTLWQMLAFGVFGEAMVPPAAVPGVPESCGNANPLHTLSWMNPADFNATTVGVPEVERHLRAPAANAPVFVVGCGHSGTTELINILNRHPLVYAYLDGPGMEFAVQPNSFGSPWRWLPVRAPAPQRSYCDCP